MPSCFSGENPVTYIYEAWTELVQLKWQNAKGDLVKIESLRFIKILAQTVECFNGYFVLLLLLSD
jgi:hypothetical protein